MLDHLEIRTRRMAECVAFYSAVLEPLGYTLAVDGAQKGFGHAGKLDFWIVDGDPSTDVHYAFCAPDWPTVKASYGLAGAHGGKQDRPPALAPHIHPDYFAAYGLDPDGRLVEFVCQSPQTEAGLSS